MKKLYKIDFRGILLKLVTNDRSDKMFLFTSKFCPKGVVSPCAGAIYLYKIIEKREKIRLQRDFCCHQNFVPWGCLTLTCSYIHLLNHERTCIKSEFEEMFLKLATNNQSDEAFLLTSKFWLKWVVCPCPRAIYIYKIINKVCIKSEGRAIY